MQQLSYLSVRRVPNGTENGEAFLRRAEKALGSKFEKIVRGGPAEAIEKQRQQTRS
jgi:hypothetical protein